MFYTQDSKVCKRVEKVREKHLVLMLRGFYCVVYKLMCLVTMPDKKYQSDKKKGQKLRKFPQTLKNKTKKSLLLKLHTLAVVYWTLLHKKSVEFKFKTYKN